MLNKMEEGSGIKMTLLVGGKQMNFNLAVIGRKGWNGTIEYEYGFVNDDWTKHFKSPYTGGNTGFGCNDYGMGNIDTKWLESYQIITTDIDAIIALANTDELKAKQDKEDFDKKQAERVVEINNLPKIFCIGDGLLDQDFEFVRSDADYVAFYSKQITGGNITLRKKNDKTGNNIYIDNYVGKDGKLLVKRFAGDMKWLFGDIALRFDPKNLLSLLVNRQKELEKTIKSIKFN